MKESVSAPGAPKAVGPYSPAVRAGPWLFVSGQIALDAEGRLVGTEARTQAKQCLENLQALIKSAGLAMSDVVKTTVFLTDLGSFVEVNEVYAGFFKPPYPARATVEVKALPKGALVEIEALAFRA